MSSHSKRVTSSRTILPGPRANTPSSSAAITNTRDDVNYLSNRFGSYTYQTPTLFALDYSGATPGAKNWTAYSQTFGNPLVSYWIREIGFYLEDQWRATDRLTVTLGARYERSFVQQPSTVNPDWPQTGQIHDGPLDLMPRIGLAYRVNDKTVVRAGYGTFFARFIGGLVDDIFTGNGMYQIADSLSATNKTQLAAGPVFPNALAAPEPAPAGRLEHSVHVSKSEDALF